MQRLDAKSFFQGLDPQRFKPRQVFRAACLLQRRIEVILADPIRQHDHHRPGPFIPV
jgi:hypothetical protein